MISVLGQCASCCTCPTATVEWDSVPFSDLVSCGSGSSCSGTDRLFKSFTESFVPSDEEDPTCEYADGVEVSTLYVPCNGCADRLVEFTGVFDLPDLGGDCTSSITILVTRPGYFAWGTWTTTQSDEVTDASLASDPVVRASAIARLPAYDGDWNDTAGSFFSVFGFLYSIRESRYRIRFLIPTANTGKNFRASWVERFIAEGGTSVSSVSVNAAGVYRPTVTVSAPPSGGTQAYATAVMSSTGTVSSIAILNPGSGYTSAPTVTVESATGGGTSSTGWVATLTAGQVTAIGSGSAGDYRPTLAFTSGGGVGATATCTLDAVGGIAAVTVTAAGSAYTSEPTLTITPKVTGSTAADLLIHLGTETAKCTVWDGATPGGYAEGTPSTWPILPSAAPYYFELAVPTSDGTTLVANLRAVCDGTAC